MTTEPKPDLIAEITRVQGEMTGLKAVAQQTLADTVPLADHEAALTAKQNEVRALDAQRDGFRDETRLWRTLHGIPKMSATTFLTELPEQAHAKDKRIAALEEEVKELKKLRAAQLEAAKANRRYPLRTDFKADKLPAKTRAAFSHVSVWDRTEDPRKQPDLRGIVNSDFVHLKVFREIKMAINVYRVRALVGDGPAILELADLAQKLVAKALTGYGPIPAGVTLGTAVNPINEMAGVRRFNIGAYDGAWRPNSGADLNSLERCLTYDVVAQLLELLEGCATFDPRIAAAAAALRELLCVDLAVRVKGLALLEHKDGALWRTLQTLRHATTGFAYACRVIGERLSADPKLLKQAQALGARHGVTITAEEFTETYRTLSTTLRADYDRVAGPDGRTHLVFPHGVQGLRPAHDKLEVFHFTVYWPETAMTLFADWLTGGELATITDLEQLGNTVANCLHSDGFDSSLLSDDMGGGGLRDPAEEKKGGPAFREVRFRGGGKARSRWHLSDRDTEYGNSQTPIASSGRGMVHTLLAFTDFPERLTWLDQADKALGQEFRVGLDVARLLCAAVDDRVVAL